MSKTVAIVIGMTLWGAFGLVLLLRDGMLEGPGAVLIGVWPFGMAVLVFALFRGEPNKPATGPASQVAAESSDPAKRPVPRPPALGRRSRL